MKTPNGLCPLCGGQKRKGKTIFSLDSGRGIVVVRGVPAKICKQCGEEWIDSKPAARVERLIQPLRQKTAPVEVLSFAA